MAHPTKLNGRPARLKPVSSDRARGGAPRSCSRPARAACGKVPFLAVAKRDLVGRHCGRRIHHARVSPDVLSFAFSLAAWKAGKVNKQKAVFDSSDLSTFPQSTADLIRVLALGQSQNIQTMR